MRAIGRTIVAILGGIMVTTVFVSAARAGCADVPQMRTGFSTIAYAAMPLPAVRPAAARIAADDGPPIVGLWQFTIKSVGNNVPPANIPDDAVLDAGFAQWHSDGTEIM